MFQDADLPHYVDPLLSLEEKNKTRRTLLGFLASQKLQLKYLLHNPLFTLNQSIHDIAIFTPPHEDYSFETHSATSFTLAEEPSSPANSGQHAQSSIISL